MKIYNSQEEDKVKEPRIIPNKPKEAPVEVPPNKVKEFPVKDPVKPTKTIPKFSK